MCARACPALSKVFGNPLLGPGMERHMQPSFAFAVDPQVRDAAALVDVAD